MTEFKGSRFLNVKATPKAIRAYLLDVGFPQDDIDLIDVEAYADPLVTVKDVLPSLVQNYPQLADYVYDVSRESIGTKEFDEEFRQYLESLLDKLFAGNYDDLDRDLILSELKTLDPIYALVNLWASEVVPDKVIYEWIEDFDVNVNDLPPRLRRAYESWVKREQARFEFRRIREAREVGARPRVSLKPVELRINPLIERLSQRVRELREYLNEDLVGVRVPVTLSKRDIPYKLLVVLNSGRRDLLSELSKLYEEDLSVKHWVDEFAEALNLLPDFVDRVKREKRFDVGFPFTADKLLMLEEFFPETIEQLRRSYAKPLVKKVPSKAPAPRGVRSFRVTPKREEVRYTFWGFDVGREDKGVKLYVEPEVFAQVEWNYTVSKYGADVTKKAVEYVKQKYPFLSEESPQFWSTVRSKIEEYKKFGRFLF